MEFEIMNMHKFAAATRAHAANVNFVIYHERADEELKQCLPARMPSVRTFTVSYGIQLSPELLKKLTETFLMSNIIELRVFMREDFANVLFSSRLICFAHSRNLRKISISSAKLKKRPSRLFVALVRSTGVKEIMLDHFELNDQKSSLFLLQNSVDLEVFSMTKVPFPNCADLHIIRTIARLAQRREASWRQCTYYLQKTRDILRRSVFKYVLYLDCHFEETRCPKQLLKTVYGIGMTRLMYLL